MFVDVAGSIGSYSQFKISHIRIKHTKVSFENSRLSGSLKKHCSADVNDYHPLQPSKPVIVCVWGPEDVTDWMSLSQKCVNRHVVSVLHSLNPTLSLVGWLMAQKVRVAISAS